MKFTLAFCLMIATITLSGCGGELTGVEMLGAHNDGATYGVYRGSVRNMGTEALATSVIYSTPQQIGQRRQGNANMAQMEITVRPPPVSTDFTYRLSCESRHFQIVAIYNTDESGKSEQGNIDHILPENLSGIVLPQSPRDRVLEYACLPYWRRLFLSLIG